MRPASRYVLCLAAAGALHVAALCGTHRWFERTAGPGVVREEVVTVDLVEPPAPPRQEPVRTPPPPVEPSTPPKPAVPPPKEIPPVQPKVEQPPPKRKPPPAPPPRPEPRPVAAPVRPPAKETPPQAAVPAPPATPVTENRRAEPVAVAPPAEASAPDSTASAVRTDPAYAVNPMPAYPESARRAGTTGLVLLRVRVGTDGQVLRLEVKESSGSAVLDRAASNTVARWRFQPGRLGGKPVVDDVDVPIRFSLER